MSPALVERHSAVKKLSIEACSFNDIHGIEYSQARQCIGFDLWTSMLAAMADYSTVEEYESETNYLEDDVVSYNGLFYIALQDTSTQPPFLGHWDLAPVFDQADACGPKYEEFFCDHLVTYLANTILFKRLAFMDVVEYKDKKVERTDVDGIQRVYNAVSRDRANAWGNILYYMSLDENKALQVEGGCFNGWIGVKDEDCSWVAIKKPKSMRTGIYRFG